MKHFEYTFFHSFQYAYFVIKRGDKPPHNDILSLIDSNHNSLPGTICTVPGTVRTRTVPFTSTVHVEESVPVPVPVRT